MNSKKPATEKNATYKNQYLNRSKRYYWTHGRTLSLDHTSPTCRYHKKRNHVGETLDNRMGGNGNWFKEDQTHEYNGGTRNNLMEDIKYNQQNIFLFQTLPYSITRYPPKPHANNLISE